MTINNNNMTMATTGWLFRTSKKNKNETVVYLLKTKKTKKIIKIDGRYGHERAAGYLHMGIFGYRIITTETGRRQTPVFIVND